MLTRVLDVREVTQVAAARRNAVACARQLGLDETLTGHVAIVATELATNLLKHSGGGRLLLQDLGNGGVPGLELLALDQGPGIRNLAECLRDGYSSAKTLGIGLGAVMRLSGLCQLHSMEGLGTAVMARFWASPPPGGQPMLIGQVTLPKPGETACGDQCWVRQDANRLLLIMVDGLGHGLLAADAARVAVEVAGRNGQLAPARIAELAHEELRRTRGAALLVVSVTLDPPEVRACGVGNISGRICSAETQRNLVSHNGIAGYAVSRFQEFAYPFPADSVLVLHSDGLTTHWDLGRYPGLTARHPSLLAAVLFRDFCRGTDDVSVLAVRREAEVT